MAASVHPRQLAFALPHAESLTRDNFLEGPANEAGLALVELARLAQPHHAAGRSGRLGKKPSRLDLGRTVRRTLDLRACADGGAVPGALATGALVVEDLKPGDFDERAMFHLMNLAREDEAYVLMTARIAPSAFEVELRDLRSRLRAVPSVSLLPPDDLLFRSLIVKFCADRQLSVDETVVSYLSTRIERSYAAVRQAVELLDTEALRLGRPVTRALAAELLRNA